jgi:hypothetical protein
MLSVQRWWFEGQTWQVILVNLGVRIFTTHVTV